MQQKLTNPFSKLNSIIWIMILIILSIPAFAFSSGEQDINKLIDPASGLRYGSGDVTIIINEGFEGYEPGIPAGIPNDWTVINQDADSYTWVVYDIYPYEGDYHLRCHWHSGGYCDDWLITPMIHIPTGGDTFEFYARAYNPYYMENWEVWITNTGNDINNQAGNVKVIVNLVA
jgi:hypothetical protein